MTMWNDFNDAEPQSFDLIPKGTIAPVRMTLKPGGVDDEGMGWTGGWASVSQETGSAYLAAEFVVLAGDYAKRKLWTNIGLYSPNGPTWAQMGRSFIRAVLNSARNVHPQDISPHAAAARHIASFGDLDGIEFLARIDVEVDGRGNQKNVVKVAVEPDHPDHARLMGVASRVSQAPAKQVAAAPTAPPAPAAITQTAPAWRTSQTAPARPPSGPQPTATRAPVTAKPSWAQ
ncbi:hypothetical protein [Eleftheria terrae]|uniref:hypothetical protein n=1 Tax=Eleftheria terrae TaxID=1597781 RepID=UPI00263B1933|nr:hypothetical protein [Eleftheria terrae]WKB50884.1 hypothetical protein N7L95_13790 [Eleftheria terrae]